MKVHGMLHLATLIVVTLFKYPLHSIYAQALDVKTHGHHCYVKGFLYIHSYSLIAFAMSITSQHFCTLSSSTRPSIRSATRYASLNTYLLQSANKNIRYI